MATIAGRATEVRRALLLAAGLRWQERQAKRETGMKQIAARGVGAADSAKRQAEWSAREAAKSTLGARRFDERMIGPRWDPVQFAPSVQASTAATPVARIVTMPSADHVAQGIATGFLIGEDLLMTNFHVFQTRSDVNGYGANFFYVKDEQGIRLGKYFELDPTRFFVSDEALDFAIVAVAPRSTQGEPLSDLGSVRLIDATGKILTGLPVNIVEHPRGGPREFAISDNKLVDILDAGFLHYEGDTDRGSSGSPLFNSDWELVGLHHSAVPEVRDGQIMNVDGNLWDEAREEEDRIHWVANEGARVSFIVERLRSMQLSGGEAAILQALLKSTQDNFKQPSVSLESKPSREAGASGTSVFNISGPVTIHQFLHSASIGAETPGQPLAPSVPGKADKGPGAASLVPLEKALVFDPDYVDRPGFHSSFLGVEIGMPVLDKRHDGKVYSVADYRAYYEEYRDVPELDVGQLGDSEPLVLNYHHYSLVMHKEYKMCIWTASNYDYEKAQRMDTRARSDLGGENWKKDPRVPPGYQLLNADIYQPAKRIDRGHIVRREDNCWGQPGLDTEYANSDTYHWTNCTPQHEAFNQENPSDKSGRKVYADGTIGVWGRFESELSKRIEAGGGQAVLFAGPVLDDFASSTSVVSTGVKIPKRFWKVVVFRESRKKTAPLQAYGFIFDQSKAIKKFGLDYEEGLELPEFDKNAKSLADIQSLAGVVFAANVLAADQFGK